MLYDNIKKICLEKKIAISEMERDLGFPRSYVCKWNENEPGIRKVQKVADYLHVSIEDLLENNQEKGEWEEWKRILTTTILIISLLLL